MWFTAVKEDIPSALHHIAHELAHSYAMGADCYSWEDWLNETHAEWNALLYELEKDEVFFEHCLAKTRERYGNRKLALKENGEEHQEFVHEAGVLVYEKIYRRYEADSIRTILRTFDHLSEKSTAKLLETLTADGGGKACMHDRILLLMVKYKKTAPFVRCLFFRYRIFSALCMVK